VEIMATIKVITMSVTIVVAVVIIVKTQMAFHFAGLDMAGSCSFWVLFSSVFRGTLERLFSVALLTITGNALD
jgi:hypothetical protein